MLHYCFHVTGVLYVTLLFSCYRCTVCYIIVFMLQVYCMLHQCFHVTGVLYVTLLFSCYRCTVCYIIVFMLQVYCMEYLEQNQAWLKAQLQSVQDHYLLIDCPGQVQTSCKNNCKNVIYNLILII